MFKKIATDWSLWLLILFNLYLLDHYQKHPNEFGTLIFLYWAQSVLIGLATFLDLLTIKHIKAGSLTLNDHPIADHFKSKGCLSFFFLLHYGGFHLVYLIFILVKIGRHFDYRFFMMAIAILSISLVGEFIRKKMGQHNAVVNVGKVFFLPYARIIPMHLMILLPAFLKISNITVFIILKIVVDIIMHFVTNRHNRSDNEQGSLPPAL